MKRRRRPRRSRRARRRGRARAPRRVDRERREPRHSERRGDAEPIAPMKVAVLVAMATGRKCPGADLRHRDSTANITPPIGDIERGGDSAASAACDHRTTALGRGHAQDLPECVQPKAKPIRMIGPSRPTVAPLPMVIADARDLHHRHDRTDDAAPIVDRIHDLGKRHAPWPRGRKSSPEGHRDAPTTAKTMNAPRGSPGEDLGADAKAK